MSEISEAIPLHNYVNRNACLQCVLNGQKVSSQFLNLTIQANRSKCERLTEIVCKGCHNAGLLCKHATSLEFVGSLDGGSAREYNILKRLSEVEYTLQVVVLGLHRRVTELEDNSV
jgi:hypothetical protein